MHDIWRSGAGLVETMCRSEPESQIDAILRDRTGERAVLTDLLTTALDYHGRRETEEPREQGRCDRLDSYGRFQSSS